MGKAQSFAIGDVVHLALTAAIREPDEVFVVVGINTHSDKVRVAKCATQRWQVPRWMLAEAFEKADAKSTSRKVRRAFRWLAAVTPDPDGWKRIECGKVWNPEKCAVGHVSLDSEASHG